MPVEYFKNLSKRVNDLLTKDFPSDKGENKVEWKGTAPNNVSIESSITTKSDGSSFGTISPKYKAKEYGTTFGLEVNTKKEGKVEVSMEDYHVPGLKTTVTGNYKPDDRFVTVGADYKHENGTVSGQVDYGKSAGIVLEGSAVVGAQGFALGGSAQYLLGTSDNELKKLHSILSYSTVDFDISAFAKHQAAEGKNEEKNIMGLNYYHRFTPDWVVGGEATFETIPPEATPTLAFGTQYRLSDDTTLKSKFDTEGKFGLSWMQKYNRNTKFTLSSTVDTKNFGNKNSAQFGFTLSFND
jgi:voltage-dependent anion channel protein 2